MPRFVLYLLALVSVANIIRAFASEKRKAQKKTQQEEPAKQQRIAAAIERSKKQKADADARHAAALARKAELHEQAMRNREELHEQAMRHKQELEAQKPQKEQRPETIPQTKPEASTQPKTPARKTGAFAGHTVAFTGTLSMPRSQAIELVHQHGGKAYADMPAGTTLLVVGHNPGMKKLDKADRWIGQVRKITEAQFLRMAEPKPYTDCELDTLPALLKTLKA